MDLIEGTQRTIKNKNGTPMTVAKFKCPYCSNILEIGTSNGRRNNSCGCQWNIKGPNAREWKWNKLKPQKEKRDGAALCCIHYKECLTVAAIKDRMMDCEGCERCEMVDNYYHTEITVSDCRGDFNEYTEFSAKKNPASG